MKRPSDLAADSLSAALLTIVLSWCLGLEQVVPGLVLAFGCWRLWRLRALEWGVEAFFLGLLLLWSLTSIPALQGRADWLVYLRGEVHLLIGLAAYLVARQVDPASASFARMLKTAMVLVAALALTGLLVLVGVLPLEFKSPAGWLWPQLEGSSNFVDDFLLHRQLGTTSGVSLILGIRRQSLFFLYQGGLATVLLVLIGWMLVARHRLAVLWHRSAMMAVVACLLLVVLTGSRSALLLSWGVVLGLMLWTALARRSWGRWVVRGVVLAILLGGIVAVTPRGDGQSWDDAAPWERVLIDFRVHSFLDRFEVYSRTFERLNERPLTGWGVQGRPGEGGRYLRLGTHSEPLNVAYRFGWVGLGLMMAAALSYAWKFIGRSAGLAERAALVMVVGALGLTSLVRTFQWDLNVFWLVMAFLGTSAARASDLARSSGSPRVFSMLGVELHPRTIDQLHGEIAQAVASDGRLVIGHQNLHGLYLVKREASMRNFAQRADVVFLDGMAVVWLARGLGHEVDRRHRVTYADWLDPLAAECARQGWRLFHLGGRPGVGQQARRSLVERYPALEMATHPGYFEPTREGEVADEINQFAPHVLMVGMGMPRQEAWVVRNVDKIEAPAILTCGACMDYRAGVTPTPPRWAGSLGLEWLFRLVREPRRLAFRYLIEPWSVFWRFLTEWCVRDRSV